MMAKAASRWKISKRTLVSGFRGVVIVIIIFKNIFLFENVLK